MRQDGFSAVEVMVTCAIAAALLLIAIPASLSSKEAGAATSAFAIDAVVTKARAIAATSGNGATLQFTSNGTGTVIRIYSGRPDAAAAIAQAAPDTGIIAAVSESTLGSPPFAVFFDSSGHASAMSGTIDPANAISSDPGCPSAAGVILTIADSRLQAQRTLPCAPQ